MDFITSVNSVVAGLPDFLIHLGATLVLFWMSLLVYALLTPHKELKLIREGNPSASLAFGSVVVGFAIVLAACLTYAVKLTDIVIWGVLSVMVQGLGFAVVNTFFLRGLPRRIQEGDVAAAIYLMSVNIGLALILAGAIADPGIAFLRGMP